VETEAQCAPLRRVDRLERGPVHRVGIGGVEDLRQRPLEPRNLRQDGLIGERRRRQQKIGELPAVPANGPVWRRVGRDEGASKGVERLVAHQSMKNRIDVIERLDQTHSVGIAVDSQSGLDRQRRRFDDGIGDRALVSQQIVLQLAL